MDKKEPEEICKFRLATERIFTWLFDQYEPCLLRNNLCVWEFFVPLLKTIYPMDSLPDLLNKAYFWDVDFNRLDKYKSMRLIIERVINLGNLNDLKLIREIYTGEEIRKTICNLNYIDRKTLHFTSLFFNIPKTRFKCYTKKQSTPIPWNY